MSTTLKLRTITRRKKSAKALPRRGPAGWAIHPGAILNQEFLLPQAITGYRLAKSIGVKTQSVNDLVLCKRGISADMAVRLGRFFGTSPEFWMNLQNAYELSKAKATIGSSLSEIEPYRAAV